MSKVSLKLIKDAITVGELMGMLEEHPLDMKVLFTWEATFNPVLSCNVYVGSENVLVLDADDNFYKPTFENNLVPCDFRENLEE